MMRSISRLLFSPDGHLSGRLFFSVGILLFTLKWALDALLVNFWFKIPWLPWDYFDIEWRDINFRDLHTVRFATVMLALALPFIWCGVIMTLKRIKTVGWPPTSVLLFFVPYLNVPFFLLLTVWPNRKTELSPITRGDSARTVLMLIVVAVVAIGCVALSSVLLQHYGWGLFIGIPFLIGFIPGLLHQPRTTRPILECAIIALGLEIFIGAALILFALEGLICIIMVSPIAVALNALGAFIGYKIRTVSEWARAERELFSAGILLLLPVLLFAEKSAGMHPSLIAVKTTIHIAAPPETVWNHVVSFSELPPPNEWIFHAGVAHPLRAEIQGRGVGAVRHCVFSTGAFVEPIEVWDEPRLLRFAVTTNPPPMREITYHNIKPPHLDGFLVSERGQFELIPINPNTTRLEGTTWYRHGLWPEWYWQLWSDYIIHTIHLRVLRHIKTEAESPQITAI